MSTELWRYHAAVLRCVTKALMIGLLHTFPSPTAKHIGCSRVSELHAAHREAGFVAGVPRRE